MRTTFHKGLFSVMLGAAVLTQLPPALAQTRDTIVVAQQADAYTLDPARHAQMPTATILFQIYDALITIDEKGEFQPGLAVSWSQPDQLTWRFKLREGVKFHNGEAFNAEAVKFTFDRALDPNFKAPYYARIAAIKAVEIVDEYTVDFKTEKPFPTMLFSLYEASYAAMIVPPKHLAGKNPDILLTEPVGTGPYRFVEWLKDDRVVLEANPDYWGGAPKIAKVIFRPIKETRTRIAELTSGGVDIAVDIQPEDRSSIESSGEKVVSIPSDSAYFMAFNTLTDSPLKDKRVRQAINHAVDVDAIQQALLNGLGARIGLTLAKDSFAYDKSWKPYAYDPEKAKALLAEAGYPDGFTITLMSRQGRYLKDKEIIEASAGFLARVGIKAEIKYLESGVWAQVSEKKGREGIVFVAWSGLDPDTVWYPLLYTGQYQSYYSNPELDKLLDAGRSTLDVNERKEIYAKAGAIMKEDAPHLPMIQAPLIYGVDAKLHWTPRSDSIIDLRKAYFD